MFFSRLSLLGAARFGFSSMGEIEMLAVEDKADRDDMGLAGFVRCREMGNAGGAEKARGVWGQLQ